MIERAQIVFDAGERGASRSRRLIDIENVSSSGPLNLTVITTEKSGLLYFGLAAGNFTSSHNSL
jgi:hypothetical protein